MNSDVAIAYMNLASRWALFFAISYKAWKTREKGWMLLSTAFFINALDIESFILNPLGIKVIPDAYIIAGKVPNFAIAILLLWGALHLKYEETQFKHVLALSVVVIVSYLWLFLLATDAFGNNFTIQSSVPSLIYGGSLIYFGSILWRHVISRNKTELLFPAGLILLGALNITYPLTRHITWFAPVGFMLGAIFRLSAALGALKFAFYEIIPPRKPIESGMPAGAFMVSSANQEKKLPDLSSKPGVILITRMPPSKILEKANPDSIAFWITRVSEGKINERPPIYAVPPTKMGILTDLLAKAIEKGYVTAYIDTFEYLMVENGFENALKFILALKDRVIAAGGTIVLVVDYDALSTKELKLLEKEFKRMD